MNAVHRAYQERACTGRRVEDFRWEIAASRSRNRPFAQIEGLNDELRYVGVSEELPFDCLKPALMMYSKKDPSMSCPDDELARSVKW